MALDGATDDIYTHLSFGAIGIDWERTQYLEPGARFHWENYGICPECHALAGMQCTDTTTVRLHFLACAHKGRPRRGGPKSQMLKDIEAATGDHTMGGEYEAVR
jgi:hypothetical protein